MKIDLHVHTNRSVDAVHSPRQMVRRARAAGLDAIAITDHNCIFSKDEARRLSVEFGITVIPGTEGGNIAVQKHWIALGISSPPRDCHGAIEMVLPNIRRQAGIAIAPHPHTRLGYADYALRGFDAVESLNGSEARANRLVRNTQHIPEVGGSDAHAAPMLGYTWTEVDADGTVDGILEAIARGRCRPGGTVIPFECYCTFFPLYFRHRVLAEPRSAYNRLRSVLEGIRTIRACPGPCTAVDHAEISG